MRILIKPSCLGDFFLALIVTIISLPYEEDLKDMLVQTNLGFSVGLVSNLRISEYLDLRFEPGLFITQRKHYV